MSRKGANTSAASVLLATFFNFTLWSPLTSLAGTSLPSIPCQFPFNAGEKDATLDKEFVVTEYRNYIFAIQFEYRNADLDRVMKIIGDGQYKAFTKESADTDHPVQAQAEPGENEMHSHVRIQEGTRSGIYVNRPTDTSGKIPIRMRLSKIANDSSGGTVISESEISTLAYYAHGFVNFVGAPDGGYFDREIIVEALKPGKYRVQISTVTGTPIFQGIPTRISIEARHNEKRLDD